MRVCDIFNKLPSQITIKSQGCENLCFRPSEKELDVENKAISVSSRSKNIIRFTILFDFFSQRPFVLP